MLVHRAIARLSTKEQTVISLRLWEELSHDEIARVLRVRPGTVRVTYSRAIKKLRELLPSNVVGSLDSPTERT
jgi:RNA polymerase sigma factor (sigma-70 family)